MLSLIVEVEGRAPFQIIIPLEPVQAIQAAAIYAAPAPDPDGAPIVTRVRISTNGGDSVCVVEKKPQGDMKLGTGMVLQRAKPNKILSVIPFANVSDWKGFDPLTTSEGRLNRIREAVAVQTDAISKLEAVEKLLEGVPPQGLTDLTPITQWTSGMWLVVSGLATFVRTCEADDALEGSAACFDSIIGMFSSDALELLCVLVNHIKDKELVETTRVVIRALTKMRHTRDEVQKAYAEMVLAARLTASKMSAMERAEYAELTSAAIKLNDLMKGIKNAGVQVQGKADDRH